MKSFEEYRENVLEKYVNDFMINDAYGILSNIQSSRSKLSIINVKDEWKSRRLFHKHKVYVNNNSDGFICVPINILFPGERIFQSDIVSFRYELHTFDEFNKRFQQRLDLFVNGAKIPSDELKIAIFDFNVILQFPREYFNSSLRIMVRPYFYDALLKGRNQSIAVPASKIGIKDLDVNECIVYKDGLQTDAYSMIKQNDNYVFRFAEFASSSIEIVFMNGINSIKNTTLSNGHLKLPYTFKEFPVAQCNVLVYSTSGRLLDLELEPKTSILFKSNVNYSSKFNVKYLYMLEEGDINNYYDNYLWYILNIDNAIDNINNPALLPDFMNEFALYRREIGLADYLKYDYSSLVEYNEDITEETIDYNNELIDKLIDVAYDECNDKLMSKIDSVVLKDYGVTEHTRTDTSKELLLPEHQRRFISPMVVFKIPNEKKFHINVYLDGVRNFIYYEELYENEFSYIYLQKMYVDKAKVIDFEFIKTSKSIGKTQSLFFDDSKKLTITGVYKDKIFEDINSDNMAIFISNDKMNQYVNPKVLTYNNDTINIEVSEPVKSDSLCKVVDYNFTKVYKYSTRTRGEGLELTLDNFVNIPFDKSFFRVYKNGRELPRTSYDIIFPDSGKNKLYPIVKLRVKYTIYELIEVEFSPIKYTIEKYIPRIPETGIIDLYTDAARLLLNDQVEYFLVNGRRITKPQFKVWCTRGMTLHNILSRYHLEVVYKCNKTIDDICELGRKVYTNDRKLFAKFIVTLMKGGPVFDSETDCTDENIERTGELYYDLYMEFLKHNIITSNETLPEYIAIKYSPLIDKGQNDTLIVDMNEKQLYYMPLDAEMKHGDDLIEIMGLYYQLLDEIHSVQVVDPNNIPPELYEKYKVLFDGNVLVLQVPNLPPM